MVWLSREEARLHAGGGSLAGSPAHGETAAPAAHRWAELARPATTDPGRGLAKSARTLLSLSFPESGCAGRAGVPRGFGVAGPCPRTPLPGAVPAGQVEG